MQRVFEPWTDERENQLAVLIERLALLCSSWAELGVTEILRLESTSFATLREYNTQSREPPLVKLVRQILESTVQDDPDQRHPMASIVRIFRRQTRFASISR